MRVIHREKTDKLVDEIIEKYTQSFAIFSFVVNADDRKMQSSSSLTYARFSLV